jgi:hypothetical protein
MGTRGFVTLATAVALSTVVACGSDSSGEFDSAVSGSAIQPIVPPDSSATPTTSSTQDIASPTTPEIEAIVSASGGGGLIDSVEVQGLTVLNDPAVGRTWLRFDLVLNSCCGDPNTVLFERDEGGFDSAIGEPPALQLSGPACTGAVACSEGNRRVDLTAPGPVLLSFDVTPLVDTGAVLQSRLLRTKLRPMFDFSHPGLDDEVMSIQLRIDLSEPSPPASGDTTPAATPTAPVTVVGGGFDLLEFPFAATADNAQQLAVILAPATTPIDTDMLDIDWTTHAALVLTVPTDLCPPLLSGVDISDGTARPVFVGAGYLGCEQPLLSHTIIASVERSLLADIDQLVLPAEPPYFESPVVAPVDIPSGAEPAPPPPPTAPPFGDLTGQASLPANGEATVATLADGTPVYVVHHHDGTVSALDPRAAATDAGDEPDGEFRIVTWNAATRIFLGGGAWDEYGRRIDGFRSSDLQGHATRVDGDVVEIGSPVPAPSGSPVAATGDPPAMSNTTIPLADPISLDNATALSAGSTALIDASVIIDPDGAHVCTTTSQDFPIEPCPPGSPTVDGIAPIANARHAWFGPILATRTETGFTRIAPTGGYAGGTL